MSEYLKNLDAIFETEEGKIIQSRIHNLVGDLAVEAEIIKELHEIVVALVQLVLKTVLEENGYISELMKSGSFLNTGSAFSQSESENGRVAYIRHNSPVYPALTYIENHRREEISMKDMAKFCHLSPSYFSKLFFKETGENFTDFLNRKKVEWACEKLSGSSDSITKIALELGFQDASYFIKVFKKYANTTPGLYRKLNMN